MAAILRFPSHKPDRRNCTTERFSQALPPFSLAATNDSGFDETSRRIQCDQKPMVRRRVAESRHWLGTRLQVRSLVSEGHYGWRWIAVLVGVLWGTGVIFTLEPKRR